MIIKIITRNLNNFTCFARPVQTMIRVTSGTLLSTHCVVFTFSGIQFRNVVTTPETCSIVWFLSLPQRHMDTLFNCPSEHNCDLAPTTSSFTGHLIITPQTSDSMLFHFGSLCRFDICTFIQSLFLPTYGCDL